MNGGRAGFVLDLGRCIGCSACVVACRLQHGWPAGAPRRRLVALNRARDPNGPTYFLSLACHHCANPACVKACPSGACTQRPDGVVALDQRRCLGCRYCEMACPFGALSFDSARGVIDKCDFCSARLDGGELPACVAGCPTGALEVVTERNARAPGRGEHGEPRTADVVDVPGFSDPAGCRPSIRFKLPRGIRGTRLANLVGRLAGGAR